MLALVGIFSIVAMLLMVASCAAGIWLTVVAFKRSVLWGFLTLIVPFAALAFTIKHWQEAKKPFLASVITGIASFVLFMLSAGFAATAAPSGAQQQMTADADLQSAVDRSMSSNHATTAPAATRPAAPSEAAMPMVDTMPRSAQHAADPAIDDALKVLDSMPKSAEGEAVPSANAANALPTAAGRAGAEKPVYDADAMTRDGFAPVAVNDASQLIGKRVKLVTSSGQVYRGEIRRADGKTLSLERWLKGGSAVLDFSKAEIESLQVQVN